MVSTAPIGMALVGIDQTLGSRLVRINPALCALTGRSQEELEGSLADELVHAGDWTAVVVAMAKLTAGDLTGFRLEVRLVHAGRHAVWVILSASVVPCPILFAVASFRFAMREARKPIWQ